MTTIRVRCSGDGHGRTPLNTCSRRPEAAFALIELIGVMAVLAILAVILFSATLRQLDRLAGDQEYAQLKTIAQAFQASVVRHRYIPGATGASNWVEMISQEMGADPGSVSTNARRLARTFLVDPAFEVGTNGFGLPYRQTIFGSSVTNATGSNLPAINPRLMLLSSMGSPLPAVSPSDFNAVWDAPDGTRPPGSVWDAWNGTGDDLKVQRIHLASLFVPVSLLNWGITNGKYAINSTAIIRSVPNPGGVYAYFLASSLLYLYDSSSVLDCKQIISKNSEFHFRQGRWEGRVQGDMNFFTNQPNHSISPQDLEKMVGYFLDSPSNTNADNVDLRYNYGTNPPSALATKPMLINHYKQYMQLYITWAGLNFPVGSLYDPIYKNPLNQLKDDIKDIADHLDKDIKQGECSN